MVERVTLDPPMQDPEGRGFLEMYIRECITLNVHDFRLLQRYAKPYQYAEIHQMKVDPADVKPAAKYVLKSHLAKLEALDLELSVQGIDIFDLQGAIKLDEYNYMAPPILEVWDIEPFNGVPCIVDGEHRFFLAKQRGRLINCVVISGKISSMLPALPLNGWGEVYERDDVPVDKRNYDPKIPHHWEPKELYRQPFHGSTGPRSQGSK